MQASIEEKQKYLRENIDASMYEDFYQFCQKEAQNVDINTWSLAYVEELVKKFNRYQAEQINCLNNDHERSYYDYQSSSNPMPEQKKGQMLEQIEETYSQVQSSKVEKSAIDLLDDVFENASWASNRGESRVSNNGGEKKFQEFQFITYGSKTEREDVRKKSKTQFTTDWNINKKKQQTSQIRTQPKSPKIEKSNYQTPSFNVVANSDYFPQKKQSPYQKKQTHLNVEATSMKNTNTKNTRERNSTAEKQIRKEQKVQRTDDSFSEKILCYKSVIRKSLSSPDLNVIVDKHEIIERSFLAPNYTMYHIKVVPINLTIKRNYEDFIKLRDNLTKFFPGYQIPYLAPNSWFSATSIDFIKDQKKMLEFFLRDLIRSKQIRNSRVFEDFLTLEDHKAIKRKFQKYEQLQKPKGIEDLCLIDGQVIVTINQSQKVYKQNLQKYLSKMNILLDKKQRLCQNLQEQYYQISQTYSSLSSVISDIEKETKKFNSSVSINEIKYLSNVFRVARDSFKESQSNSKFQFDLLRNKIIPFIKYEKSNLYQLNNLLQIDNRFTRSFEKRALQEKVPKSCGYNTQKLKEGKKGVLEESRNILLLKYQVAYTNRQVCMEGMRILNEMGAKIIQKWKVFAHSNIDKSNKSLEFWKNLLELKQERFMPPEMIKNP